MACCSDLTLLVPPLCRREPGGMATLSPPEPEAECHTVAHLITRHELRILEAREPPSTRLGASDYTLLRPAAQRRHERLRR